jgi:hypothetical protein
VSEEETIARAVLSHVELRDQFDRKMPLSFTIEAESHALKDVRTRIDAIRADERARIVKWLRDEGKFTHGDNPERRVDACADAIERGEHLK